MAAKHKRGVYVFLVAHAQIEPNGGRKQIDAPSLEITSHNPGKVQRVDGVLLYVVVLGSKMTCLCAIYHFDWSLFRSHEKHREMHKNYCDEAAHLPPGLGQTHFVGDLQYRTSIIILPWL